MFHIDCIAIYQNAVFEMMIYGLKHKFLNLFLLISTKNQQAFGNFSDTNLVSTLFYQNIIWFYWCQLERYVYYCKGHSGRWNIIAFKVLNVKQGQIIIKYLASKEQWTVHDVPQRVQSLVG